MCQAKLVSNFEVIINDSHIPSNNLFFKLAISNQKFEPKCKSPKYIPLDRKLQALFVDGHNKLRNKQALGQTGSIFKNTASDMATTVS